MPNLAGEKFELRLIRSLDILLHEEFEEDRSSRLASRFRAEKVLYNPLILGKHKGRYILIDGANRFEALNRISCRIVLAQIVDYMDPEVMLKTWFHFVSGMNMDILKKYLKRKKLKYEDIGYDIKPSSINEVVVRDNYWESIRIRLGKNLSETLVQLRSLNKFYETGFTYHRIDSDTDISDMDNVYPGDGVLFIFPQFSKENIIKISSLADKLPAGITRHLIPNRVLHIKFPVLNLKSENGLDKKNSEFLKFILHKINNKKG